LCDLPSELGDNARAVFTTNGLCLDDDGLVWRLRGPGYPAPRFVVYGAGGNFLLVKTAATREDADAAAAELIALPEATSVVVLPVDDRRGLR